MASKLQDLINRLCPNGVEYRKLGEVCDVCRGVRVVKSQLSETGKYAVYQNSIKPLGYHSEANCSGGTAFVIGAGAAGEVGYCAEEFWAADDCYYLNGKGKVVGRFLYYVLTSNQGYLASRVRKASIPRLARGFVEDLIIPVPPLEVQSEIVQILDNFAELTAELTAELEKRKKQYEHYRRALLCGVESLELRVARSGWPMVKLGEIGRVAMCKRILKQETSTTGDIPFYKIGTFGKIADAYISKTKFEEYREKYSYPNKGDILISAAGTIGRAIAYDGAPAYYQDSNIVWLEHDQHKVLNRFLYYCYQLNPWHVSVGGTIPRLYNDNILKAEIPLPPLAEQRRIVSILDRFDRLCNDLTSGLPGEIAARKKQYAYYRDKLLDFKPAPKGCGAASNRKGAA